VDNPAKAASTRHFPAKLAVNFKFGAGSKYDQAEAEVVSIAPVPVFPATGARPMPTRQANADLRSREYLTPAEIEKLMKAAKDGRWGLRDACLIIVAYRHGLRAKEACELEWSKVEFGRSASLHVRRAKKGKPAVHPIRGDELRMLTALRKEYPGAGQLPPQLARPAVTEAPPAVVIEREASTQN
jgi:integrase